MVHPVVLGEGHLLALAVNRRGGPIDEAVDAPAAGELQGPLGAADVDLLVSDRVFDGGPHARQGGQVDDGVEGGAASPLSLADAPLLDPDPRSRLAASSAARSQAAPSRTSPSTSANPSSARASRR